MLIQLYLACILHQAALNSNEELTNLPEESTSKQPVPAAAHVAAPNSLGRFKVPENAWDDFYNAHGERFFKDRHYLEAEHPELARALLSNGAKVRILDLGCGVGNSILPLLETAVAQVEYLGVDVSPKAIEILRNKLQAYGTRHCCLVEVLDVVGCSQTQWEDVLEKFYELTRSRDGFAFSLMIFSVSAFPPAQMLLPVKRACEALARGSGRVCFRDYLRGDLAEERFPKGQKLGRGLFMRQDGTLSFFFTPPGLESLFVATGCVKTVWMRRVNRTVENRAAELKMNRAWIGTEVLKL